MLFMVELSFWIQLHTEKKYGALFSSLYATAFASEGSLFHVLMWANEKHLFIYSTPDIL